VPLINKDPDKQQAKTAAKAEAEAARQAASADKAGREVEAAFARSPQGLARAASQAGDGFFQLTIPLSQTERTSMGILSGGQQAGWDVRTRTGSHSDVLSLIESEGWRLQDVDYVFQQTGAVSRDKLLSSGQTSVVTGQIVGIYLFRRAAEPPAGEG
jgi:hypothetical protein